MPGELYCRNSISLETKYFFRDVAEIFPDGFTLVVDETETDVYAILTLKCRTEGSYSKEFVRDSTPKLIAAMMKDEFLKFLDGTDWFANSSDANM